jgi:hypothetical protein
MLQTCSNKHESCSGPASSALPKRTVHFRKLSDGDISVKLEEHGSARGTYIALSHCWGSSLTCKTTIQNIRAYQRAIPWGVLTTTFQDSIIFCLELGVDHIWIDALCIVQDSSRDWEIESSQMANIYQNAFLTLAATISSDGSGGCFSINHRPVQEHQLDSGIMVRKKLSHWQIPPTKVSARSYPLLSRAWVLQERYMSRRVLHFCEQELVWECLVDFVCECGGILAACDPQEQWLPSSDSGLEIGDDVTRKEYVERVERNSQRRDNHSARIISAPQNELNDPSFRFLSSYTGHGSIPSTRNNSRSPDILTNQWHDIVEKYSTLSLSRETDRIPALSGLALKVSAPLGLYLCGLWSKAIARNLLWKKPYLDQADRRPARYTGPSWSWASVKGVVSYWHDLSDYHNDLSHQSGEENLGFETRLETEARRQRDTEFELKRRVNETQFQCFVTLAGENLFGEVTEGRLKVSGWLQSAKLQYIYYATKSSGSRRAMRHDPMHYRLLVQGRQTLELPFFADFILSEEPRRLSKGSELYLLLMLPHICLVLHRRRGRGRLGLLGDDPFERIGIVRQPSGYLNHYGLNWMLGSSRETVTIV